MITHDPSSWLTRNLPIVATAHGGIRMYWGTAAVLPARRASREAPAGLVAGLSER